MTSSALTTDTVFLYDKLKLAPQAYREEVLDRWTQFQALYTVLKEHPSEFKPRLGSDITFLAMVSKWYTSDLSKFPILLMDLLDQHADQIHPKLRLQMIQALIKLKNSGLFNRSELLSLFFRLFKCSDKKLRPTLFAFIVQDITNINRPKKNPKINSKLQNFMFKMLKNENSIAAKKSLDVMVALFRKKIWMDEPTVQAISTCLFDKRSKLMVPAIKFFLGQVTLEKQEQEQALAVVAKKKKNLIEIAHSLETSHSRKTKKKQRKLDKTREMLRRIDDPNAIKEDDEIFANQAIDLLHDPDQICSRMFSVLQKSTHLFETRLLMMDMISKIIGYKRLLIHHFYPFCETYISSSQKYVTKILTFLIQAVHLQIPPDWLRPIISTICKAFVHSQADHDMVAYGLNVIREMCCRNPFIMTEEVLIDLTGYKRSKVKSVSMAARSLIHLYRSVNPFLLKARDRGKISGKHKRMTEEEQEAHNIKLMYGDSNAIPKELAGLQMLEQYLKENDMEDGYLHSSDDDDDEHVLDTLIQDSDDYYTDEEYEEISEDDFEDGLANDDESDDESDVKSDVNSVIDNKNEKQDSLNGEKDIPPAPKEKFDFIKVAGSRILTQTELDLIKKFNAQKTNGVEGNDDEDDIEVIRPRERAGQAVDEESLKIPEGLSNPSGELKIVEKITRQRGYQDKRAGKFTNREHQKNKPTMMLLHKIKRQKSFAYKVSKRKKTKQFKGHVRRKM